MQKILLIFFSFICCYSIAQTGNIPIDKIQKPKYSYRSIENPYYWKNRPPYPGYWQQDVDYKITATIDEITDIISGEENLTYYNNSPDTLYYVYFHLYEEAFQPGSYMSALNIANTIKPTYGKYETLGLGTEIQEIIATKLNGFDINQSLKYSQDNTILKVFLSAPLLPDQNITFHIPFQTYFDDGGSMRRRMKLFNASGYKHYDGVHWYPRICVYDKKFGWDTNQHLGREFYGDYGTYEVTLNFASNFIVGATGILVNPEEAMPDDLRARLDIKNFMYKPMNEQPSEIIPYIPGDRKIWKYYALNVHDFAFTADPTYRIGEVMAIVNGRAVLCQALAQEPHASRWQNAADYTKKIIETFSADFGDYIYPKIIVADARDGMEYPMLTLDGGYDPNYRYTIIHEVGHNWFFGMVGNNETYRAALDEGFAQFLTAWGQNAIDGNYKVTDAEKSRYKNKHRDSINVFLTSVYLGYLNDAKRASDATLNTHSDMFNSALGHGGGYSQVYYKMATMLFNLQYVLGDTLFQNAMKHYVSQWKLCHPYFEDFRNSIINYTHVDLNWFFDEWMETTKTIDYSIAHVKKNTNENTDDKNVFIYDVEFKRKGRMQMPIDFTVITKNNDTINYYIPNTWFTKYDADGTHKIIPSMHSSTITLPAWIGWDLLNDTYTATITLPSKIKNIIIDPSDRLADINKLDNTWKAPIDFDFDYHIWNYPKLDSYELKWRPDLWFNTTDGIKVGLNFSGNYMNYKHILELSVWYNTLLGQGGFSTADLQNEKADIISFDFNYKTASDKFLPNSNFIFDIKHIDGIWGGDIGFEKYFGRLNKDKFTLFTKSILPNNADHYVLYPDQFQNTYSASLNLNVEHNYNYYTGNGKIIVGIRGNAPYSKTDFGRLTINATNKTQLGKFDLTTRFYIQGGYSNGNTPTESQLYMAGANPEELLDNKYTRAEGWVPQHWVGYGTETNHFQMGGGLNLRGYAGYLMAEEHNGTLYNTYKGNSGASINAELQFNRLFKKHYIKWIKMEPYIFFDAGSLVVEGENEPDFISQIRTDAGIGSAFTWTWFGPLENIKPFTLRIDFPLLLNRPPFEENTYFKMRYVVGINRAF